MPLWLGWQQFTDGRRTSRWLHVRLSKWLALVRWWVVRSRSGNYLVMAATCHVQATSTRASIRRPSLWQSLASLDDQSLSGPRETPSRGRFCSSSNYRERVEMVMVSLVALMLPSHRAVRSNNGCGLCDYQIQYFFFSHFKICFFPPW